MQHIDIQTKAGLRRWCRECGLPSPLTARGCDHCGGDQPVRNMSPISNTGNNMVQNNVLNVDAEGFLAAMAAGAPTEVEDLPPPRPSFGHALFIGVCKFITWTGIIVTSCVLVAFVAVVVLAVMKAHG